MTVHWPVFQNKNISSPPWWDPRSALWFWKDINKILHKCITRVSEKRKMLWVTSRDFCEKSKTVIFTGCYSWRMKPLPYYTEKAAYKNPIHLRQSVSTDDSRQTLSKLVILRHMKSSTCPFLRIAPLSVPLLSCVTLLVQSSALCPFLCYPLETAPLRIAALITETLARPPDSPAAYALTFHTSIPPQFWGYSFMCNSKASKYEGWDKIST